MLPQNGDWSRPRVEAILGASKEVVRQALVGLYRLHSPSFGSVPAKQVDGRGFNKFDSMELTELAHKVIQGKHLSATEMMRARRRLGKYWKQIATLMHPEVERAMEVQEERDLIAGSW